MKIEKIIQKEIHDLYKENYKNYSSRSKKRLIGILGGLGPEASIDLERRIFNLTPAEEDQGNFRILHFSNPCLPDRTLSLQEIRKNNFTPAKKIINETIEMMDAFLSFKEDYQCHVLAIPCSSLFCFFDDIQTDKNKIRGLKYYVKQKSYEDKVLNTIEETMKFAKEYLFLVKKFGLLATSGTLEQNLYQKAFRKIKKKIVVPDKDIQENYIMAAIYEVKRKKKREAKNLLLKGVSHLEQKGAEIIILGCSELPLVLKGEKYLDTTLILAFSAIKKILTSL